MAKEYTLSGTSLSIKLMYADIMIVTHNLPNILVCVLGDDYLCDHLTVSGTENVEISLPIPLVGGGYATRGNVNSIDGQLCIDYRPVDTSRKVNLLISVPIKTATHIKELIGNSVIADTYGDFSISGSMGFSNQTGSVANCQINTSSYFTTNIHTVTGRLDANMSSHSTLTVKNIDSTSVSIHSSSHSRVTIEQGKVKNTDIHTSSHARAHITAQVDYLNIHASSHSVTRVQHCTNTPNIKKSSGAEVTIG